MHTQKRNFVMGVAASQQPIRCPAKKKWPTKPEIYTCMYIFIYRGREYVVKGAAIRLTM